MANTVPSSGSKMDQTGYEDFFKHIPTQTQTYEQFLDLLPSVRDGEAQKLLSSISQEVVQQPILAVPVVHPLKREWELAAVKGYDDDDLSTEEGEWADLQGPGELKDCLVQEVDEEGIPVVTLKRASSSFFLDGPGQVQVDNFCPDEAEASQGNEPRSNPTPSDAPGYTPSIMERGGTAQPPGNNTAPASGHLSTSASRTVQGANGYLVHNSDASPQPPPGGSAAPRTEESSTGTQPPATHIPRVSTLEDELKCLGLGRGGPGPQDTGNNCSTPADGPQDPGEEDVEMEVEVVQEVQCGGLLTQPPATAMDPLMAGAHRMDLPGTLVFPCSSGDGAGEGDVVAVMQLLHAMDLQGGMLQQLGIGEATSKGLHSATSNASDSSSDEVDSGSTQLPDPWSLVPSSSSAHPSAGEPGLSGPEVLPSGGDLSQAAGCSMDEGPEYVPVEKFSLDPDFDYDNVKLTPRPWPYNRFAGHVINVPAADK